MDVALLLLRDRGERRRFSVEHDVLTIGRGEGCDLRIPLGDVSRKHCSLVKSDEGLQIQDIGSSNGTFVNGKRIQEASLRAGDQIRIGSLRFVVQIDGQPAEDDAHAFTTAVEQTAPETPARAQAEEPGGSGPARPEEPPAPAGQAAGESRVPAARKAARIPDDVENLIDVLDEDDDDANFP